MTNEIEVMDDTTSKIGALNIVSSSRTSIAPAIASTEKSKKITDINFKRFVKESVSKLDDSTPKVERIMIIEVWKHSDFLCNNYILNGLYGDLYNVYSNMKTSKDLWDALEKKYKTKDVGLNKFIMAKFLDFKMVDSKYVVTQVQKLQVIINDLLAEGLVIKKAFQVAAMIKKLPHLWKDFKNYLKHKRKEIYLEDLIVKLRIEEDNKAAEKRAVECKAPKKAKKKAQANVAEFEDYDLCAMLSEYNLVGNPRKWWIDFDATRHVCANKELFASYEPTQDDDTIYMANLTTAKVEGTCKVLLKMTFGKVVTLKNVLHVPNLRKNLISTPLLTKNEFKCVFVSDKVIISKNEVYVEKGYLCEGLFKLNVMAIANNQSSCSTYLLESSGLWHECLGHVNYKTLQKLISLEVLPNFE
ncbi:uncharacterized protein LOC129890680 [Solanum dulcamara]|uniref:uncharacterized protein LOC129890680 n=1 Tax=Solanum dulcamara TaxID=45834 RepID=UPI002484FC5E|nr:uncharacterized protein LOC129890680 [Solanum dulcamara]